MAEENSNNKNTEPVSSTPGFDLGQYIESQKPSVRQEPQPEVTPMPQPRFDVNAELGYDPAVELSKYMKNTFKTSIDAGIMDAQDLEEINNKIGEDPLSIDSVRNSLKNLSYYSDRPTKDPFGQFGTMMGDFRDPNNQNTFYKRYYEHPKFDELGFSPFRDNELYYNENSSLFDDFRRAGGEMLTLAGIGLAENFGISDLEDMSTAKKYAEAAAIGTSSRKGLGAFGVNTFLNSGYTLGLIAGFAIEEGLLIGAEILGAAAAPASGGTSLAVTGAAASRQAYSIAKFGKNLAKAYETVMQSRRIIDKVQDASKARKFFNASMNFLNPLENTAGFIKNYDQISDLSKLSKTVRGAGAFIRDTRNVRAAWNEAALEANMVQDEMQRTMLEDFRKKNGRAPNADEAARMAQTIKQATTSTASWNAALILGTNKLTLGPLLRPMNKGLGGGIFSLGKGAGKFIYTASKKGVPEAYKLLSSNYAKRSLELLRHPKALLQRQLIYSVDNFAEGFQEISQEAIADWQKEYHTAMFQGNETRGAYYDFLGQSIEKQMSPEGFEVFMSGFLMQKFVSPITGSVGAIANKQKYSDLRLFVSDRQEYYKQKDKRRAQDEKIVQKLNDFYKNNTEYLSGDLMEFVRQGEYSKMLKNAESIGDVKSFYDIKDSARFSNFVNLIRHGRLDSHLDLLKSLKDLTAEEVREEYKMDLNVFHDVIDKSVERAKMIESTFKGLQAKMPSPVNYQQYKPGTPEYMDAYMSHVAWNDVIEKIAFQKYSFTRALERTQSIIDGAQNKIGLKNTAYSEIGSLFGKTVLGQELQILQQELDGLKAASLVSEETKKQIKDKETKLKLLKEFNSSIDNLLKRTPNEEAEAAYPDVQKAYTNYITYLAKKNNENIDTSEIDESLKDIIDYYKLSSRTEGIVQAVNMMIDPNGFNQLFRRVNETYEAAHASMKEEIAKSYQAYKTGNKLHNDLVNAFAEMGVFVTLEELQKLKDEGVFPEHFYYDTPTDESLEVAHNSEDYRKIVDIMREYYDIKSGIDAATFDEQYNLFELKSRNKKKDDKRTYDDLAEQFGFKGRDEVPLKEVLEAVINSKYIDAREKALAEILYQKAGDNEMVVFSKEAGLPAEYNVGEDKVVINATFSADEYKQGRINSPLEYFILHGQMQKLLDETLDQDTEFRSDMEQLLKESQEAWKNLTPEEQAKYAPQGAQPRGLDNINDFAFAAMTNLRMQAFLSTVKTSTQQDTSSLWKKFVDTVLKRVSNLLKVKNVEGTVLNATLGIITTKIDPAGVKPSTAAPKSTGTTTGVSRSMPVSEIKANHPELYNSLIDVFIKYNEGRVDQGNDSLIPENATREQIGKLPFFERFVNDRAFTSPDKVFKDYNAKIGAKPGQQAAGTQTSAGVAFTITRQVRQQLYDLGYSKDDVNKMKPQEAQDIIKNQTIKTQPVDTKADIDAKIADIKRRKQENDKKYQEAIKRHEKELAELNKREGKNYVNTFDILNVNEYSEDKSARSNDAIELAKRQEVEIKELLNEKRTIEEDANSISFGGIDLSNKKSILDKLKNALSKVYQTNRQALDEGFTNWAGVAQDVANAGGENYVAHGMGKTTIASAFNDLITLFEKGINPLRGRGSLDVAPLAGGVSVGTTATGNAYMDGAFTLVANRSHQGKITDIRQVGGIIVNDGIANTEVLSALRGLFPDLVIESTSNTKSLVEQLNAKYDAELAALEGTTTPTDKRTMPKAPAEEIVFIAPKSGIATREVEAKLRQLGFTAADIKAMTDPQKYQYANDNLTKQESKEWYDFIKEQTEDFTAQRDTVEEARAEINNVINNANTYEEWADLPNIIYGQSMQNTFIKSNYTVDDIKKLLEEKRKSLPIISNFSDVKVGEFIGVERKNKQGQKYVAIVQVTEVTDNEMTLQYLAPDKDGNFNSFKINKDNLKDTKMYKSSKALNANDIDEGPEIDPQGNDAAKQSITNLNDVNFDQAEIENTADSKTSEEVDDDFLNDIKNNCE